ncbi:MAG: ATP-dependent RNA helicase DbpA, partial [Pontibacterium sp.]
MTQSTAFSSLDLPASQLDNLSKLGYASMTPIQALAIPEILAGHDLIAKAKTGSGKTAAFGIGLLNKVEASVFRVQGIVLCPTRELASQVADALRKIARYQHNIKILTLCGGQPIGPQIGSLKHGAHIVVGTPGRICDHIRKGTLTLGDVHTFVLDEADRMLEMGFRDDIDRVAEQLPALRQTLLFSATYPPEIGDLSARYQYEPKTVEAEAIHQQSQLEQHFVTTEHNNKLEFLGAAIGRIKPASSVVFCNTRAQCQDVTAHLRKLGVHTLALHGDLEQRDRDQVLVRFANRSSRILVATDVAARGLDIDDLDAVFNFELPRDPEVYVHRIGRTGRGGKSGVAVSLASEKEAYKVERIESYTGQSAKYLTLSIKEAPRALPSKPEMVTLCIAGGKKDKVRPGDILGALTGDAGLEGNDVGKI